MGFLRSSLIRINNILHSDLPSRQHTIFVAMFYSAVPLKKIVRFQCLKLGKFVTERPVKLKLDSPEHILLVGIELVGRGMSIASLIICTREYSGLIRVLSSSLVENRPTISATTHGRN